MRAARTTSLALRQLRRHRGARGASTTAPAVAPSEAAAPPPHALPAVPPPPSSSSSSSSPPSPPASSPHALGVSGALEHESDMLRALLGGSVATGAGGERRAPAPDDDLLLHTPAEAALRARQVACEEAAVTAAVTRHAREAASARRRGDVAASRPAVVLIASWHRPLALALRKHLDQRTSDRSPALDTLRLVDPEKLAAIAVYEVLGSLMRDLNGMPLATVAADVGDAVRAEINADKIKHLKAAAAKAERNAAAKAGLYRGVDASLPLDSVGDAGGVSPDSVSTRKRRKKRGNTASVPAGVQNGGSAEDAARKAALFKSMAMATSTSAINYAACQADIAGARWTPQERVLVGASLIDTLLSSAVVEVAPGGTARVSDQGGEDGSDSKATRKPGRLQPAFKHYMSFDKRAGKRMGMLSLSDAALQLLMEDDLHLRDFVRPKLQPMIVRPRPWISPAHGPYLSLKTTLVRAEPSKTLDDALANADLHALYDGLNALGETAWKVNTPVLKTAKRLWDNRKAVGGLVSRNDIPLPVKSDFYDAEEAARFAREAREAKAAAAKESLDAATEESEGGGDEGRLPSQARGSAGFEGELKAGDQAPNDVAEEDRAASVLASVRKYRRERRKVQKMNRELFSLRAHTGYQLDEAEQFSSEEKIYLPHNVDFRGRAYPIPVYLQHMGADLMRSMLSFAGPGVPLGERGVYWLKVHLANLLGADKLSFEERVAVADDAMSRVLAAATDPLGEANVEWWSQAEDPFQLLAACFEFGAAAGRHGNETSMAGFHSRLPVSMDGSCNGLQHYAALGRDSSGGKQVNLIPSERPQDVYTGVAELVRQRVDEAAAAGDEIGLLLRGKVSRKVVKQTVMTSVYGVTLIGARAQMENRLREVGGIPEGKTFACSMQLARWTLASLGDIFSGATRTMDWLSASAKAVSRQGAEVQWLTPLGLPVIQPYRKRDAAMVRTAVQRVKVGMAGDHMPVSRARQQSAFAPNFVHSIDSSHMLLTAVACRGRGLTFAAVHDSFWTHAAHVDAMNATLRATFVQLHTRELLVELRDALLLRHPDARLPPLPARGDLDLDEVLRSPYFFS